MKIKYLKLKQWLLVSLGSLLGVSVASCTPACEYGTPEATYHVKGTVTDGQGHPIQGIGVMEQMHWSDETHSPVTTGYQDTTDKDGNYNVTLLGGFPHQPVTVDFNDIDGVQNGSYRDTMVTVATDDVPLTGGTGSWYEGEGNVTLNVTLTEKANK